jgi:hypothetical protein
VGGAGVNAGRVITMLRRKAIIKLCVEFVGVPVQAHFDGLQPKSANLPASSTALPHGHNHKPPKSPRGASQYQPESVRGAGGQRELRGGYDTSK